MVDLDNVARSTNTLIGIAGVVLLVVVAVMIGTSLTAAITVPRTVYTIAQLRAAMSRHPGAWQGRRAFVRAIAYPLGTNCPPSTPWCTNVVLADGDLLRAAPALTARAARPNQYVTMLRRLPLLDRLIADPQQVAWGRPATYRIYISAQSFTPCISPCLSVQLESIVR